MTAEDLAGAEAACLASAQAAERARQARNALVLKALGEGWTQSQIARATGLTRGRIGQLAQSK